MRTLLCTMLLLSGLASAQDDQADHLRIAGSDTLGAHLVPDMMTTWLKKTGYTNIKRHDGGGSTEITATGDTGVPLVVSIQHADVPNGIAGLVKGTADISMSTRQPDEKERKAAWNLGNLVSPDQEYVIALDGLAVIAGSGNRMSSITTGQLQDVFSGKIKDWSALGGSGPIAPCVRKSATGPAGELTTLVLDGAKLASTVTTFDSDAQVVAAVAKDSGRLCVVGLKTPLKGVKPIAVRAGAQAMLPDEISVKTEDYPLQNRLYFHTSQSPPAVALGFAQYAISAPGQAIVDQSEFVSLKLAFASAPAAAGNAEQAKFLGNARRVSTSLRFAVGEDLFDSRARQDLVRLASFLHGQTSAKRNLLVVGFANPDPKVPMIAINNSNQKADVVSSELKSLGIGSILARGFGGLDFLVPSDQPAAGYRNNRVELWIQQDADAGKH